MISTSDRANVTAQRTRTPLTKLQLALIIAASYESLRFITVKQDREFSQYSCLTPPTGYSRSAFGFPHLRQTMCTRPGLRMRPIARLVARVSVFWPIFLSAHTPFMKLIDS